MLGGFESVNRFLGNIGLWIMGDVVDDDRFYEVNSTMRNHKGTGLFGSQRTQLLRHGREWNS